MYKLVGFDLDGTIVDSLDDLYTAVNYALAKENLRARNKDEIRSFIGHGVMKLLSRSMHPVEDENILLRIKSHFDEYYSKHYCDETKAYDGIKDMFEQLTKREIKVFIFSNKPVEYVKVIAETLFGDVPFVALLGGCSQFPPKPSSDNFMKFIEGYSTENEASSCNKDKMLDILAKSVYVGDSDVDIKFSNNAGIDSVGVLWGYMSEKTIKQENPTYIVSTVEQLLQTILHE